MDLLGDVHDHHCFLPLYVTCGDRLLVSDLRRSNIDAAKRAWATLPGARAWIALIAVGLAAFAVYSFLEGWYRKITPLARRSVLQSN